MVQECVIPLLPDILKKMDNRKIHLYFDLDGTLAPIVRNPENISIPKSILDILSALAKKKKVLVAIISGRELAFLKKHIVDSNIHLIGSHGSELSYGKPEINIESMNLIAEQIHTEVEELQPLILENVGALLEKKRYGVALHYRMCTADSKKKIRYLARKIASNIPGAMVTIFRGKQVAEINPNIGWNKGTAIRDIRRKYSKGQSLFEIYLGDDISDEKAFKVLNETNGFSIRIRKKKQSLARYFLMSQKQVEFFLQKVSEAL